MTYLSLAIVLTFEELVPPPHKALLSLSEKDVSQDRQLIIYSTSKPYEVWISPLPEILETTFATGCEEVASMLFWELFGEWY